MDNDFDRFEIENFENQGLDVEIFSSKEYVSVKQAQIDRGKEAVLGPFLESIGEVLKEKLLDQKKGFDVEQINGTEPDVKTDMKIETNVLPFNKPEEKCATADQMDLRLDLCFSHLNDYEDCSPNLLCDLIEISSEVRPMPINLRIEISEDVNQFRDWKLWLKCLTNKLSTDPASPIPIKVVPPRVNLGTNRPLHPDNTLENLVIDDLLAKFLVASRVSIMDNSESAKQLEREQQQLEDFYYIY